MRKHLFGIFLLALVMVALPLHLRFAHNNPTLAGKEPYYHARMAVELLEGIPKTDDKIVNGRPYILQPYHLVLAAGYRLIGPLAFNLLPVLFALLSYLFFWLLLRKFNVPEGTQLWILLAYALSPPLMTVSTIGTPHAFILFLLMSGAWLLNNWWILAILNFSIVSLSGLAYNVTAILFLLILLLTQKKNVKQISAAIVLSAATFIIGRYPSTTSLPQGISQYFSDLGGIYGLSIFAALLSIVGAVLVWEHKKSYYGAYAIVLGFLVASFFFPDLLVFANIPVSALAGVALAKLSQRKWKLKFLRQAALLVLFCGLLFSSISQAVILADRQPTPAFFKALEFSPGTVLTHEDYGFWVQAAGHKAVMDPLAKDLPEAAEQSWDAAAMFSSTDLEKARLLMRKYNVTHVLITPEMQHGQLWEREGQGLAFLVENSETFKRLETGSNIGVWRVR